jgi:hypothetical protein
VLLCAWWLSGPIGLEWKELRWSGGMVDELSVIALASGGFGFEDGVEEGDSLLGRSRRNIASGKPVSFLRNVWDNAGARVKERVISGFDSRNR